MPKTGLFMERRPEKCCDVAGEGNLSRADQYFSGCPPAMPVSRTNPPTGQQVPPSSVSIGKKPMNYPPNQPQPQAQQQQPKSARAASKAPVYNQQQQQQNRHPSPPTSNSGSANKTRSTSGTAGSQNTSSGPTAAQKGKANANKIWSTSTTEERERIKDFWLGLGEQERRNLVKIEKDTVLKKMKEQQKHSCSCAVCGRKRLVSFLPDPQTTLFLLLFYFFRSSFQPDGFADQACFLLSMSSQYLLIYF